MTVQGSVVKIYQDLSNITLQRRRELRPLLDVLMARSILYRWKFPFGLSASHQGCTATLRVPKDLDHFCSQLDIPLVELTDWYSDFRPSSLKRATSMDGIAEAGNFSIGRHRPHPLPPRSPLRDQGAPRNGSPTASPAHRRARFRLNCDIPYSNTWHRDSDSMFYTLPPVLLTLNFFL